MFELEQKALGIASSKAAIEAAKKAGTYGLSSITKRPLTRPMSPRLTIPSIPEIPEPERIENMTKAKDIPSYLNKTSLEAIEQKRKEEKELQRQRVLQKYDNPKNEFSFHENTKYLEKFNTMALEIQQEKAKDIEFNNSYVNIPPDFHDDTTSRIKLNASAILREDYLFRKQQEKDAKILKDYESELRDPVEFYAWQNEMKVADEREKLHYVELRRDLAKQASENARNALLKQKENNKIVADVLREQDEVITRKVAVENEINVLNNRLAVKAVMEIRDTRPKEAVEKVFKSKVQKTKLLKEELEELRLKKIEEEKVEEEIRADKIRQLRALNTVHKKHIKVFDPTESSGLRLMDEMSYMEMKERLEINRLRAEADEEKRRKEILGRFNNLENLKYC